MSSRTIGAVAALAVGAATHAAQPQLGGPMKHLLVTLQNGAIHVDFESGDPTEVMLLQNYDEMYTGPAEALNGMFYNGQYGWLAGGFINLPPGSAIWIEALTQTDGLETREQGSFNPIFTTEGAEPRWRWNGAMIHNWYSAIEPGAYEAVYMVYVGDLTGSVDPSFNAGFVTMQWMIPQPPCVADVNGDGIVDTADLGLLLGQFGGDDPLMDLNGDGAVDTADLGLLLGEFGSTCPVE